MYKTSEAHISMLPALLSLYRFNESSQNVVSRPRHMHQISRKSPQIDQHTLHVQTCSYMLETIFTMSCGTGTKVPLHRELYDDEIKDGMGCAGNVACTKCEGNMFWKVGRCQLHHTAVIQRSARLL